MTTQSDKQQSLGNLQPKKYLWEKGKSGNPSGRPKKEKCLVNIIEQYLNMTPEQLANENKKPNLDIGHHIAIKYVLDCHQNPNHTDKMMDRLYGQPQSAVDVTTKGNEIKSSRIYNIINPETRILLEKLDNVGRVEPHTDIQPEPQQLLEPAISPEP